MKKQLLALAIFGLLFTSCKKEVTVETTDANNDTTKVITTTEITTDLDWTARMQKAEENLNAAKEKVKEAIAKGDKKAEAAAQKTADEAEAIWTKIKNEVREGTENTKEALKNARDTAKVKYNEVLEKAKAK